MKMKFFEKIIFKDWENFQKLSTQDKRRYVTLYGHYHFSEWLAGLVVHSYSFYIVAGIALILCIGNIMLPVFIESRNIWLTVNLISLPFIAIFAFLEYYIYRIMKLEKKAFCEWFEKAKEKIQNILFGDFRVVPIWKWRYVKRVDKEFYKHLHSEDCRHHCYDCSFKLAYILNDPKVKIIWMSIVDTDGSKWGHAVIERGGFILDTNTRKSYRKNKYLKAAKSEIFKEYTINQYSKVISPYDLDWEEFGQWCERNNTERCMRE